MATKKMIKTLKELSILNKEVSNAEDLLRDINKGNLDTLNKTLTQTLKLNKAEADRAKILKEIEDLVRKEADNFKDITDKHQPQHIKALKLIEDSHDTLEKQTKAYNRNLTITNKLLAEMNKAFSSIVKHNQEIYETSHNMQLENNVTWREFTKLYNSAYDSARRMNDEIGKSIINARELIKTQDLLMSTGWKDIDGVQLNNVVASVALLQRTLGSLDDRLLYAFQTSYRQFGNQTDRFITQMGNRLNAFGDSFGLTVGMLQGAVASMMTVNTFIARNNMNAQLRANESFMQAAALSSQVGITNLGFIEGLTRTSEFGTASQLADIYSAGAYLDGFDTSAFLEGMATPGGQYGATRDLISSIYNTLTSMEDTPLLRNQFMQSIQSGFGLSQDDIASILTHGGNLDEYDKEVQEKLLNINNSMEDELKGLRMDLMDRLDNWWENSGPSQGIGRIFNEIGLYGLTGQINTIIGLLVAGMGQDSIGGALLNKTPLGRLMGGGASTAVSNSEGIGRFSMFGPASMTTGQKWGLGLSGLGVAAGSNMLGANMISNNTSDDALTNIGGWASNILGGAAGGAMMGGAIGSVPGAVVGGIIGAIGGVFNSIDADNKKRNAIYEMDAQERRDRQASRPVQTGDPVIDALNNGFSSVVNAITGEGDQTRRFQMTLDLIDKGSTKGPSGRIVPEPNT